MLSASENEVCKTCFKSIQTELLAVRGKHWKVFAFPRDFQKVNN